MIVDAVEVWTRAWCCSVNWVGNLDWQLPIWQFDFRALIISRAMMIHCCLLHITFWVTHWLISAFIAAISVLLSSFEHFSAVLFELASEFYGVPPRASFPTEKCAILILGAHEGAPITH